MKASLTLVKVPVTAEKLAILFEKLTGRKPDRRVRRSLAKMLHALVLIDCVRLDRDG